MEWSGQQSQVPQHAPQPVAGPEPTAKYYGANPLQGSTSGGISPPMAMSGDTSAQSGRSLVNPTPLGVSSAASAPTFGVPPMVQPGAVVQLDDNVSDVDDVEWVNRAKRAIGGTRGDPHRQVQLVQHLRSQYLKQRFGRTVHTDEA